MEALDEGDDEFALQQFEIALSLFKWLDEEPIIAEIIFNKIVILKAKGAEGEIPQHLGDLPVSSDPVIEAITAMLKLLTAKEE